MLVRVNSKFVHITRVPIGFSVVVDLVVCL